MNDDQNLKEEAEAIREETATEAPELQQGDRIAELERQLEAAKQDVLYAQADTQNVRRRLEQDKANATAYAVTNFARDLLSVKDNLDRGLAAIPEGLRNDDRLRGLITGIEATGRELEAVFQRHGITRVEAIGQPLDPNRHQAMIEVPNDEAEPGTIVQELQAGYMLKERLLRPAMVGVARKG